MKTFLDYVEENPEGMARYRCEWIVEPTMLEIYMRRSIRFPGVFVLANITIPEINRGKGVFTRFLNEWQDKLPLTIENIINPTFERFISFKRNWNLYDLYGENFYYNDLASVIIDKRYV